jgi:hypothetical protein
VHLPSNDSRPIVVPLSLILTLATLWLLVRGYQGLSGDAQLYAFQALARNHLQLAADLYLQNTSQDQFTIFSPTYAWFISRLGMEQAARLLTLLFTACLLTFSWSLARRISGRDVAWFAVASLLIVAGDYGGAGVFQVLEPYLTARLPAEAMIVCAIACYLRGTPRAAWAIAIAAMFVHPLMALPGCLVLVLLRLPLRTGFACTIGGILAVLASAAAVTILPAHVQAAIFMDPPWLQVVQERSQFLFLRLWSPHDFEINARPFIYLGLVAILVEDTRVRKLCAAIGLVGAAGLAVSLIGDVVGPVAILVQGQAWRWDWLAVFMTALLLPAAAWSAWQDPKCGPLCALLLVCGCIVSAFGTVCVSLSLALWVLRSNFGYRATRYFRLTAIALAAAIMVWIAARILGVVFSHGQTALTAQHLREIFGLRILAAFCAVFVWWMIRFSRIHWMPFASCVLMLAMSVYVLPPALAQARPIGSESQRNEFADWVGAIPLTGSVLIAPARDVGTFVWFTLLRPNYLALDQSAGVVFSRVTALEIQRRSEVILPLTDQSWKILSKLRSLTSEGERKVDVTVRPLTSQRLVEVCNDEKLGFVIAPENVGFNPLRHKQAGAWKDWNLYDCRNVRLGQR